MRSRRLGETEGCPGFGERTMKNVLGLGRRTMKNVGK